MLLRIGWPEGTPPAAKAYEEVELELAVGDPELRGWADEALLTALDLAALVTVTAGMLPPSVLVVGGSTLVEDIAEILAELAELAEVEVAEELVLEDAAGSLRAPLTRPFLLIFVPSLFFKEQMLPNNETSTHPGVESHLLMQSESLLDKTNTVFMVFPVRSIEHSTK